MSALTDFLHKLVDHAGVGNLHGDIDALAKSEEDTAAKSVETDIFKPVETKPEDEEGTEENHA